MPTHVFPGVHGTLISGLGGSSSASAIYLRCAMRHGILGVVVAVKVGVLWSSDWEKGEAMCRAAEAAASPGTEIQCQDTGGDALAAVRAFETVVAWGATAVVGLAYSSETAVVREAASARPL